MKKIYIVLLSFLALSCGGSDDGSGPVDTADPTSATLVFPLESSVCTEGKDFTDTTSTITFRWKAGSNTTDYKLLVTDVSDNNTVKEYSIRSTQPEVSLDVESMRRGSQYKYKVVSSNRNTTNTAESTEWSFFNAGVAVISYAPFPATAIAPERGEELAATTAVTLKWNGLDVDGADDIVGYDVYFGTTDSPALLTSVTAATVTGVEVASGNTYYWRIVTKDKSDNESGSATFSFSVN